MEVSPANVLDCTQSEAEGESRERGGEDQIDALNVGGQNSLEELRRWKERKRGARGRRKDAARRIRREQGRRARAAAASQRLQKNGRTTEEDETTSGTASAGDRLRGMHAEESHGNIRPLLALWQGVLTRRVK